MIISEKRRGFLKALTSDMPAPKRFHKMLQLTRPAERLTETGSENLLSRYI